MRVGIDAQGVVSGMGRVASFIKGQATMIAEDLQGMAGRWLGVIGVEQVFEKMHERVTAIKHAADETGLSVELIQGIFNKLSEEGIDYEKVIRPLTQLTGLTKDAKGFLGNLADEYVKLNTQEERNAMLMGLGIKNWQALIPLLEQGRAGIEEMSKPGMFKLDREEIDDITTLWEGIKGGTGMLLTFAAQATAVVGVMAKNVAAFFVGLKTGETKDEVIARYNAVRDKEDANKVDDEGYTLAQRREELEQNINKLHEERLHVREQLNDRDKFGVEEMANRARQLLGMAKMPRGLNAMYTVTPAMAASLQIQRLEDAAKIAMASGNNELADRRQHEADQIRAKHPEFKAADQFPTGRLEEQMTHLNSQIDIITTRVRRLGIIP